MSIVILRASTLKLIPWMRRLLHQPACLLGFSVSSFNDSLHGYCGTLTGPSVSRYSAPVVRSYGPGAIHWKPVASSGRDIMGRWGPARLQYFPLLMIYFCKVVSHATGKDDRLRMNLYEMPAANCSVLLLD